MGQTEYEIFIVLATLILLVFIGGIVLFVIQYHKKKLLYEREKEVINEQHARELLHTKLEIQLQTMQDISREIHDNVGQQLTLASIYANQIAFDKHYPDINDKISSIGQIINESLADLRSLSKNLKNANAEIAKLEVLIQNLCNRMNALEVCKVDYKFNEHSFRISTTIKNFILRIVQEFLHNSLKHANCKNILINFDYRDSGLFVQVKDDGVGFNIGTVDRNQGIGLSNMQKRAELIGAEFSMKSKLSEGTELTLFIPVDKLNAS